MRVRQDVRTILCHVGSQHVPVCHERCDTAIRTWIQCSALVRMYIVCVNG